MTYLFAVIRGYRYFGYKCGFEKGVLCRARVSQPGNYCGHTVVVGKTVTQKARVGDKAGLREDWQYSFRSQKRSF